MKKLVLSIFAAELLFSCKDDKNNTNPQLSLNDTFEKSAEGWVGDFADYPVGQETFYELKFSHEKLPLPLDTLKKAIRISGNNHSDDLFMFMKKKVSGLKPNQAYAASFEVSFASNAAKNQMGVGGAPGESVYFGIGMTSIEPKKVVDSVSKHYTMNIKKMQQAGSGDDMKVIGNVANGTDSNKYVVVKRTGEFIGKSDAKGEMWLIVGTDSGFEATTTLYYTGVKAVFTEVKAN